MPIFPVPIVAGVSPTISQGFGGTHGGADLMLRRASRGATMLPVYVPNYYMPHGIPALAYDDGVVSRAGTIGTGGRVEIKHAGGLASKYYHMRNLRVKVGDRVKAGQPIATIYHNVVGYKLNHLHYEMFRNGIRINPETLLAKAQKIDAPENFLLKIGLAVGAGLLISKYVFK